MPFYITKGDRRPLFVVNLVDDYNEPSESAVNLTTAGSANFSMRGPMVGGVAAGTVINRLAGSITNAVQGEFTYPWSASDTTTAGTFQADTKVYWNDGKPETFPNSKVSGDDGTKFWTIIIEDGMG